MDRIVIFSLALLLTACSPKSFESKKDMLIYLTDEENGFIQHKTVNGVEYTLLYRPTDLMVAHELPEKAPVNEVMELVKKYRDHAYFTLSLGKNNREILTEAAGNKGNYRKLLQKLSFDMDRNITVTNQQRDTIPVMDFIYPRMYDLDGKNTIMFVLKRTDKVLKGKRINIAIADLGLMTGEVTFRLPTEIIRNEPKINF